LLLLLGARNPNYKYGVTLNVVTFVKFSSELIKSPKYIGNNPHRKHCKFIHLLSRLNRKYCMMDERKKGKKKGRKKVKIWKEIPRAL
jgi:hypothetical protein